MFAGCCLGCTRQSNCTMRFLDATKFIGAKATSQLQPKNDNAYE